MEIKRNEATLNRPEGDRVLDALYVFTDLKDAIRQLKDEEAWHKNDRNGITIFKTDNLTMVVTVLHKKAAIKDNTVQGMISIQVIDGKIKVTTIDGDAELKEGQMINLHSNEQHSIEAVSEAAILLTNFSCP